MGTCLVKPETSNSAVAPYSSPPSKQKPVAPRVRLFGAELCPFTCQVRIALQYKGIPYETVWLTTEDLKTNTQLEWIGLAEGTAKLPILQDEDRQSIGGSSDAILEKIESSFPEPPLVPKDSLGKNAIDLVGFIRESFTPLVGQLLYDADPFVQKEFIPHLFGAFDRLNAHIAKYGGNGPFLFGTRFTLADACLIPFLFMTCFLENYRGIFIGPTHTHLLNYRKRMHTFPCYAPVRINSDLMLVSVSKTLSERPPPPLVSMAIFHHRSILHHLEALISTADELASLKPTNRIINPAKGSIVMQIRKLSNGYGRLWVLMQEHAQMEERTIFPALEKADRGITRSAMDHHARDLPMINGIREDMKAALALEQGTRDQTEVLNTLTTRLRTLQESILKHFEEEERDLLCLLDAADVGMKRQTELIASCVEIMEASHAKLFPYLLAGLQSHEIQQYVAIMHRCLQNEKPDALKQMISACMSSEDECNFVWKVVQERNFAFVSQFSDMGKGFYQYV